MPRNLLISLSFMTSTRRPLCDRKNSNDINYLRYLHRGKGRQRYPLCIHIPTCICSFFDLFSFILLLFSFISLLFRVGIGPTTPPPPVHVAECKSHTTSRVM